MGKKKNKVVDVAELISSQKEETKGDNVETVTIENELEAKQLLTKMLEKKFDELAVVLIEKGYKKKELEKYKDELIPNVVDILIDEDESNRLKSQSEIVRLLVKYFSDRVYTEEDIQQILKNNDYPTIEELEKYGIKKKELKAQVKEYAKYLSEQYGFIKERLQNALFKLLRDNLHLPKKELNDMFINLMLESVADHYKETKDRRVFNFSNNINLVSVDDVFKSYEITKGEVKMKRLNPNLDKEANKEQSVVSDKESNGNTIRLVHYRDSYELVKY